MADQPEGELFTCSYHEYRGEMGVGVRTSLGKPKYLKTAVDDWPTLPAATPHGSYFHAENSEFDRRFLAQLEKHGIQAITEQLERIREARHIRPLVLLCFEWKPGTECHRRLFAQWWLEKTGEEVPELGKLEDYGKQATLL